LKQGQSLALVSDGGTPLISDPGWRLVRDAIDLHLPVTWIPGSTALIGGLVLSGLPTDRFVFEGFLPLKSGARRKRLESLKQERRTIVFYEAPHRLVRTLVEIREVIGDVAMSCSRELTKRFEETRRGCVSELIAHFKKQTPRGEFVLALHLLKEPAHP
jgi:16S rRNA (cytidine1402-2'-O)-methyltransferase